MILCKDVHALLHVISLVDWPKHVKFFFFYIKAGGVNIKALFTADAKVSKVVVGGIVGLALLRSFQQHATSTSRNVRQRERD